MPLFYFAFYIKINKKEKYNKKVKQKERNGISKGWIIKLGSIYNFK